jgi:hypothetical protein
MEIYATPIIWIEIIGDKRPEQTTVPMTKDDKGLISKLYEFMSHENIKPLHTLVSGGGRFSALFEMIDGEKVSKWLDHAQDCLCA